MRKLIIYGGDIDEFLRCPYRLIKCKHEGIRPASLLSSEFVEKILMKAGLEFEDKVMSQVEWEQTTAPVEKIMEKTAIIKHPVIELDGKLLKMKGITYDFSNVLLIGCPDMIVPYEKGNYVPLDIKSHKDVTRMDKLRIGFYSLLLKFKFGVPLSKGFILLKDESLKEVDAREVYSEVIEIIQKICEAKRGNQLFNYTPQLCAECPNCTLEQKCLSFLKQSSDLTLLYGIGRKKAELLRGAGIKNIKHLLSLDLDNFQYGHSKYFLKKLQLLAKSFSENKIIQIGQMGLPTENIVYFDIETDLACERVWMIGFLYNGGFKQLYADNWRQEKKVLVAFIKFLRSINNPILFSYSGTNFDRNVTARAILRQRLDAELFNSIPHYDICNCLRRNYLFPIQKYKLKELGKFLQFPFKHGDLDGFFVALAYGEHLRTKKRLPKKIFDYNKDDVCAILFMLEHLQNRKDISQEYLYDGLRRERLPVTVTAVPNEDLNQILKLRNEGMTMQEIATKFDKSIYYIYSRLNKNYLPSRANKRLK